MRLSWWHFTLPIVALARRRGAEACQRRRSSRSAWSGFRARQLKRRIPRGRQHDRWSWLLVEVEARQQVAQLRGVLPHVGPGVGSAVRLRVDARPAEEQVLDELVVGIEA